jgi:uncharacterized RDD family membrane protein YckC
MYEIQKASMLKRISAFLLDFILLTIAVTGFALLITVVMGLNPDTDISAHSAKLTEKQEYYESTYGVSFETTEEEFYQLPKEQQDYILNVYDNIFATDPEVIYSYNMIFYLTLTIATISLLLSFLLLEFVIPMLFKNGQTVGKKVFNLGLVHSNGIRITGVALFARSLLGKFTIETMIPIIVLATLLFGSAGPVGILVLGLILVLQLFVFFKSKFFTPIHDVIGHTVVCDLSSQLMFDSVEELIEYKKTLHEEEVKNAEY